MDADSNKLMEPVNEDGKLYYTFSWDQTLSTNTATSYKVSLTGIDAEGREVPIPTDDYYKNYSKNTLKIDGTDWNYQSVNEGNRSGKYHRNHKESRTLFQEPMGKSPSGDTGLTDCDDR